MNPKKTHSETHSVLSAFPEITPPSFPAWGTPNEVDQAGQFERSIQEWEEGMKAFQVLSDQHLYNNPKMSELDLRIHRAGLCGLISSGESLAIEALKFALPEFVVRIDLHTAELMATLNRWHGPPEEQLDVPESFKQSMREAKAGQIVDFDLGQ